MKRHIPSALFLIALVSTGPALALGPGPGDVYREFSVAMKGATWRVTDPGATHPGTPGNSPGDFLPNALIGIDLPHGTLDGAIRADMMIDFWGGHVGTIGQRLRLNGRPWIDIPELTISSAIAESPAGDPECYTQQWNPEVAIPLSHLVHGENVLEGTSGGQTCFSFNWGQWGWYGATLRVYYNPSQISHPTGRIVSPAAGDEFFDHPTIVAEVDGGAADRIEFVARYHGPDVDGDGIHTEYQESYQRLQPANGLSVRHNVATTSGATSVTWDTSLVPDQAPGEIRLLARICNDDICTVTQEVEDLTLVRDSTSIRLLEPRDVPRKYWVRANKTFDSEVLIPEDVDLNHAIWAKLVVRTWNGINGHAEPGQDHHTKFNGFKLPDFGANHFFSYDLVDVPVDRLQYGANVVEFRSESSHHGAEILWPGPALLIGFDAAQPRCGDGEVGAGEQCDTGGQSATCDADCTYADCGDGDLNEPAGEECDDGNSNDFDVCANDCTTQIPANCGDSLIGAGEECDDGAETDQCDADCSLVVCGDGYRNALAGEECDDGNQQPGDACEPDCRRPDLPLAPAYYGFEGQGSTVLDSSGFGNDGQLVGGAARTSDGYFGGAVRFGGNDERIDLGGLDIPGSGLTLMAWIRADDFDINDGRILSKTLSPATESHYWMLSTIDDGGMRLRFRVKTDTSGTATLISSGRTVYRDTWTHVAATYDGVWMRLYQDGFPVGSLIHTGPISVDPTVPVSIGDNPQGGRPFDGSIDEVRIENRALSSAEIRELMDRPLDDPPGCSSDVQCDDGLYCNGEESCNAAGNCMAGTPPDCGDGLGCTADSCDEKSDSCKNLPDDSVCDDGLFCNGAETCSPVHGCSAGPEPCPDGACDDELQTCADCSGPACESGTGPLPRFETGSVTATGATVTVPLGQVYDSPVVVTTVRYEPGFLPVVTRVSNVRSTSFDLRLQGAGHDQPAPARVDYLVVEEGIWELQGTRFEAHRYLSEVTDHAESWVAEAMTYGQEYESPVVIGQVMSDNDPRWSVFWSSGHQAHQAPAPGMLRAGRHVGEDPDRNRIPETVGYVVFEAAHGWLGGTEFEADNGIDWVRGVADAAPFRYKIRQPMESEPAVVLLGMAGMDGLNGAWPQVHDSASDAIWVTVDEDVALDDERLHTTEQLDYLVFGEPIVFPGGGVCSEDFPWVEEFDQAALTKPDDWYDSGMYNSLHPANRFKVYSVAGEQALGTISTATAIHSHFLGENSESWANYTLGGRMRIAHHNSGMGVTVLSDYPNEDRYYRLRRHAGEREFRLDAHGTELDCDQPHTGVTAKPKRWYEFEVEAIDLGDHTRLRARVWPTGQAKPDWQQSCTDAGENRLARGTVGVWSKGISGKYWDRLTVECATD